MRRLLVFLFTLVGFQTFAQAPYIFTKFDLVPGAAGSDPDNFYISNGKLFFTATSASTGRELWVSDGTLAGTKMLLDINSGAGNAFDNTTYLPGFVEYNGKLYFSAFSSTTGYELWTSDGTTTGTVLLKDIYLGTFGNVWHQKAVYNGKLYFSADGGTASGAGQELYVTDGTVAGTVMLKDIIPGGGSASPMDFTVCNGKLLFTAIQTSVGRELFSTDGTAGGTQMVKDINPGGATAFSGLGIQHPMVLLFNKVLFAADDGVNGEELWVSDGTPTGTVMVRNLMAGSASSNPFAMNWYTVYNNKAYFWANGMSQIWCSNGTSIGTVNLGPLSIFRPNIAPNLYTPNTFAVYKDRLFFSASDHSVPTPDEELWVTDGSSLGTKQVKNICTATTAGFDGGSPYQMIVYKNMLYFQARPTTLSTNYQLFKSDSTAAGTTMLAPTGSTASGPFTGMGSFINYNGTLFFASSWSGAGDNELWSMKDTTNITGIAELTSAPFNLYPNPNDGTFTIQLGNQTFEKGTMSVYDMMGREVYFQSQIPNSKFQITLNQPKGIYMVKLLLNDMVMTKRVMVE
jgi:ELWxxDGT repeat protein